ncbi:MAG TPA: type I-U CRISPR-associated helicase/endonuclease Cas3 [Polyangia bacterium]|nr:type I-U CRISPR-associated helicase/endonuclease Cas3 [Polyangia bacterium]
MTRDFTTAFENLTGKSPFPWQKALYDRLLGGDIPASCDLPTGLGKTSVIAIWLLARIAGAPLPRRLVYVVNRRTVVDQTTDEVLRLRENSARVGLEDALAVSTLRGQMADNRAWSADPSKNAVICGTVDMIGSRLLFGGYRIGFRSRPLHAGFLGQDTLVVHDEAHLEPAFQQLLVDIQLEQNRAGDPWPIRVMELTATSRSSVEDAFRLTDADRDHPMVAKRLHAIKRLALHASDDRVLPSSVAAQALAFRDSGLAVLLYLRTIDAVTSTVSLLRRGGVQVQQLTGTMRGYERDRLVDDDPVFARFLPDSDSSRAAGTVYLVCTSAGEVGVNLSGDHLVCDLTTFDSMAQRFGRVNRFGQRNDSELHVFHPSAEELDAEDPVEARRLRTLRLLQALKGDASPAGLGTLDAEARRDAFAPEPKILEATEILFDSWALTTIPGSVPGRPEVAPYLHGVADWEPPTAQVAWRKEVGWFTEDLPKNRRYSQEVLDDYPLKPHELLSDRTSRIIDALAKIAAKQRDSQLPVWIVSERGRVTPSTLPELVGRDRKRLERELDGCTILLSPASCGPVDGMLTAESGEKAGSDGDVADEWYDTENRPMRQRVIDSGPKPEGMRLVRSVSLVDREEDIDADDEGAVERPQRCDWYERPRGADTEGSRSGTRPVLLDVHGADVEREAEKIVERLALAPALKRAVVTAARLHDIGKNRSVWQRSVGNTDRTRLLAKSGGSMKPLEITGYRHELGSILDAERSAFLRSVDNEEERELILHLIAAHHGRARPHFPEDELFDPEAHDVDLREVGVSVATRFAKLQKRFGRWGLAYLESLVRAADYAASANPSETLEVTP